MSVTYTFPSKAIGGSSERQFISAGYHWAADFPRFSLTNIEALLSTASGAIDYSDIAVVCKIILLSYDDIIHQRDRHVIKNYPCRLTLCKSWGVVTKAMGINQP